jgi:hypothetical protein
MHTASLVNDVLCSSVDLGAGEDLVLPRASVTVDAGPKVIASE